MAVSICKEGCGACTAKCHRVYKGQKSVKIVMDELFWNSDFDLPSEEIPLTSALNRVTTDDIYSAINFPAADTAGHDGAAFRYDDAVKNGTLKKGEYEILDMGTPIPDGYDTFSAFELYEIKDGNLIFKSVPPKGSGITKAGSSIKKGELLVEKGHLLSPANLGFLKFAGITKVNVKKKPVIGILPIGDNFCIDGAIPKAGELIEGNGLYLSELVKSYGGDAFMIPPVKNDKDSVKSALESAVNNADCIFTIGSAGVSENEHKNCATKAVTELGKVLNHGLSLRPGGKATFTAVINGKPLVGFPGPMHAVLLMAETIVPEVMGMFLSQKPERKEVKAILCGSFGAKGGDAIFSPHVYVTKGEKSYFAEPICMGDNTDTFVRANATAVLDPSRQYKNGDTITVRLTSKTSMYI